MAAMEFGVATFSCSSACIPTALEPSNSAGLSAIVRVSKCRQIPAIAAARESLVVLNKVGRGRFVTASVSKGPGSRPLVSSAASKHVQSPLRSCAGHTRRQGHRDHEVQAVSGGGGSDGGKSDGGRGGGGGDGDSGEDGGAADSPGGTEGLSLWARYLALLDTNPVPTKAITSMLINMLGDLFCQVAVEKRESLDRKRLFISALIGGLLVGPTLHYWYSTLGTLVTAQGNVGAGLQLFLDQFVFSPSFICVFFAALLTLEGRPQDITPKLKQDWGTTVVTNWKIWIPFQFLNFRLVPPPLQVAAANIIALAWNVYLSFASHTKVEPTAVA